MALSKEDQERIKKRWGNRNSGNTDNSTTTGSSAKKDTATSPLSDSDKKRISERWSKRYEVDDNYVNTFIRDTNSFFDNVKSSYDGLGYETATSDTALDSYKSLQQTERDLKNRAQYVRHYLAARKDYIDEETYKNFSSYLDSLTSSQFTQDFFDARDYYSQWGSKDEYDQAVAQQKKYEEMLNYDIAGAESSIQDLEQLLSEYDELAAGHYAYTYDAAYYTDSQLEEFKRQSEAYLQFQQKYGSKEDLEKQISELNRNINNAQRIQKGVELASVADPTSANYDPEFSKYSGYAGSTWIDSGWDRFWTWDDSAGMNSGYEDIRYDYINDPDAVTEYLSKGTDTDLQLLSGLHAYSYMTKDQVNIYNYYYAKGGKEAADEYLDSIQDSLNALQGEQLFSSVKGHTALEMAFGVGAGLDQFGSGLRSLFSDKDYIPTTPTQYASGMVREDLADTGPKLPDWMGGASLGQGAYDLTTTTANMVPSILTSAVVSYVNPAAGAAVGSALMGASAAGNAYQEAVNLGYDKDQARAYSTLVGASEAGLQYLMGGIGKLGGKLSGKTVASLAAKLDSAYARLAVQYGTNMLSEGFEEYLQEILTPMFKNFALGTDEEIELISEEAIYSFLLGAISSGFMEGGSTVKTAFDMRSGKQANIDAVNMYGGSTKELIAEGLASEAGSESRQFAEIMKRKTDKGKSMTGYEIRQQVAANDAQFAVEDYDATVKTARAKLTELGQTQDVDKIAEAVAKKVTGQELTRSEKSALVNSFGSQVAKEMSDAAEQNQYVFKSLEDRVGTKGRFGVSESGVATIRESEKAVDIDAAKVVSVGDGQITFKTEDGTEVYAGDIDFADDDQSFLVSAVSDIENITPAAAEAVMQKIVDKSKPLGPQMNGIDEAYTYGYHGYSVADLKAGYYVTSLTEEQMMYAYRLGESAKKISVDTDETKRVKMRTAAEKSSATVSKKGKVQQQKARFEADAEVYFMDGKNVVKFDEHTGKYDDKRMAAVNAAKILSKLGIGGKYYFFESYVNDDRVRVYKNAKGKEIEAPNGIYTAADGSIYIDLNAGNKGQGTTLYTLAHELSHFVKDQSEKQFQTLADLVKEAYDKTDMTMHERVVEKQNLLSETSGEHVTYDEAFEEVVCDALSTMISDGSFFEKLTEIKVKDKGLFNTIKKFFQELFDKFKKVYEGLTPEQKDAQDIRAMKEMFDRIQTAFAEALVESSENFQASLTPGVESIVTNEAGDPVAYSTEDGSVMLSIRTYEENGRTELRKYLDKCVSSNQLTKAEMQEMLDGIEEIYTICKEFKDKYAPFSAWSDAAVVRDTHGRPVFSVVTPNGDYKMNLDFSLVCKKRRTLDAVFNEMSKRGIIDDFELGQKSVVKINEIIRRYGLETACALCFVDAKRFRQASVADSFTNLYNELVLSLVPEDKRSSIGHFNFAGYETIKAVENGIHTWKASDLDFSHLDYVLKNYASGTVEHKAAKYIKSHAEGRKLLLRGDFMSSKGFDAVKTQNPAMMKLYNAKKGTGGPKAAFGDVQYLNEIVKKAKNWTPAKAYEVGGVRIQSFSDYVPRMVFDYVQMIYDLAATNLPAHAYSKEALFVKQFGLTGIKINMSLIPAIKEGGIAPGLDANGNYVWAGESFDYETAKEIQNAEGYTENCGTICVGVSYQHIVKLLGDPNIRMVIPYHKSGLNPIVAHMNKLAEFTDYTSLKTNPGGCQSTMDRNGSKVAKDFNFNEALRETGDPKATARKYLDWCAANEYKPRFAEFAWHENYYKLLEDFTLYDKDGNYVPQREVRAVFPKDGAAFGSMKELIESGLEEDAIVEGKRDSSLASIVDEIQWTLPKTEAEISEEQVAQADHDLEGVKHSDRDYMAAVENGTKYSYRGKNKDGIEVYETSQTVMNMSWKDRKAEYLNVMRNEYRGRTAKFERNGHVYYARFDQGSIRKHIFGDNRSSSDGVKALIKAGADGDVFDLVERSRYTGSQKNKKNHTKADYFDYFVKTVQIDGKVFDLVADVEKTYGINDGYVYTLALVDNTTKKASPALGTPNAVPVNSAGNASIKTVAQPTQKVNKNSDRYSERTNAPVFYSQMGKVVEGMKQEKFGASSVISMLRGRGVKAEEIRWSGIQAWLDGKKSVAKAELLEFINGSMLHIDEKMLDGTGERAKLPDNYRLEETENEMGDPMLNLYIDGELVDTFELMADDSIQSTGDSNIWAMDEADLTGQILNHYARMGYDDAYGVLKETKWGGYKLDGGTNYRELLFKMPGASYSNQAMRAHWGDGAEGVLAHARIQDFDANGKKMLFIEEIQSDWHNAGREFGYEMTEVEEWQRYADLLKQKESAEAELERVIFAMDREIMEADIAESEGVPFDDSKYRALALQHGELRSRIVKAEQEIGKVEKHRTRRAPHAPFAENYHEFVLKRLIRMAAEEGYDSIGWTTADIQNKRWSGKYAEGYRIEYDQDMPKFLKKYGKQWGTTVGKTQLDNGTEVWSMAITDSMQESVLREGQAMYSERTGDSVSNRSLLANAFEGITNGSEEYKLIQEYKGHIKELNKLESKLSDLNREIRKIRFTEGEYDANKLRELEGEAQEVAKEINRHDWKLLNLEASEPLRRVIDRERKKARQETRDHVKEIQQNKKARAEQAELRQKIRKKVRDLNKLLNRGNKKQNVKEDMKGFVSKALELADYLFTDHVSNDELIRKGITVRMTPKEAALVKETEDILSKIYDHADSLTDEEFTRLDTKRKANEDKLRDLLTAQRNERLQTPVYKLFSDLVTEYSAFKNSKQDAVKAAYNPEVERFLRSYIGESNGETDSDRKTLLENMRVADMTTEELWKLDNAYQMVLHAVRTANKLFVKGKAESIEQVVNSIAGDFSNRKIPEKDLAIVAQKLANKIGWDYEKLYYALDRIGSEAFTELFMNLANSENIVMQDIIEAVEFRDKVVEKYGHNNWAINKKIDTVFMDNTGKHFRLTLGEMMALYAYSRREGAYDHLEYGGFMFGKEELKDPNPANTYKLNSDQLKAITDTLTTEQKAYAEEMQKYLSEVMGEKGNEVSTLLYGIKMFGEKNYFPIHVSGVFKAQAQESRAKAAEGFQSMSNAGFTHAQNSAAKAPIILESFDEVWSDHVNEMSRYHGAVPALEDIRRVMNRSFYSDNVADSTAIKQLMINKFGNEAAQYFDNLYREANSGAITDKLQANSKKMLSLFRKNSVAYSASVLVQQPASIVRAYAMIDRKYFGFKGVGTITSGVAKAVADKLNWTKAHTNAYNEMLKYAPGVTMTKEIGGFDTATGGSIRSYLLDTGKSFKQKMKTEPALGKVKAVMELVDDNAIANLPNVADKIAWIEIWNACKRETVAKHKDLATNSEEFMKIVGDRFTEVIRATQVYDSIFAKSPMLKSKNLAVQMLVSFMNEPNTVANMAEKAVRDMMTKGDRLQGMRTAHVLIHSIIFTGVLKSIIYAMRDDDEDETYTEKYIEALTGSLMNDFNPLNYIPIARDVWSVAQGYDVERADMAIVADAIGALDKVIKAASTDRDGMTEDELIELDKKVTEASWNLVESLAAVVGIPMKNIRREINAVIDHAKIASANAGKTTAMSAWDTIGEAVIDSIPFMGGTSKTDKLYAAIIEGDTEYVNRLKDTYKSGDAYHTAIRKALRENDPRIKEAAQAHINGDPSKRVSIARQIMADGFILDDVVSAINSEINAMLDSDSSSGAKKEKGFYTAEDFVREAANGDWASVRAIKDDIIQTAQKNGKTKDEAEEDFESTVQTNAKKAYLDGSLDDATAKKLLAEYAGKDEDEAAETVRYWAFSKEHSEYQDVFNEANVNKYYEFAEPADIPVDVYVQYLEGTKGLETIRDEWGDEVKSKREQVLEVIDSLPLTWQQKDALYLAAGYAESKIWDVPW